MDSWLKTIRWYAWLVKDKLDDWSIRLDPRNLIRRPALYWKTWTVKVGKFKVCRYEVPKRCVKTGRFLPSDWHMETRIAWG